MRHLVIGDTSQLAQYFCNKTCKIISSRNIPFDKINKIKWDKIFLCFAEQRTFIENDTKLFCQINVDYTLNVINKVSCSTNKIIVYLTAELWNQTKGGTISIKDNFNYHETPYIQSKKILYDKIKSNKSLSQKVLFMFPVNFNSVHRKSGYLFSKIFESIRNKKKIIIGDTYFYRDLIHPKFVVKKSLKANSDEIIGSGRLTFVNDFIRDLYDKSNMDYEKYVKENISYSLDTKRNIYYLSSNKIQYSYKQLLHDTLKEL